MDRQAGSQGFVVAVDGPAGSGKSTIARAIAQRMHWVYMDSGAIYRAVALAALRAGIEPTDGSAVAAVAESSALVLESTDKGLRILLDGEDVSSDIRSPVIDQVVALVAMHPVVRAALLGKQRALVHAGGVVMDGRDIGTVVAPDAPCKLYVTATEAVRVQRRYAQRLAAGQDPDIEAVAVELRERDRLDQERLASPLRKASDAIVIDTTNLSVEEALAEVFAKCPVLSAGHRPA